ncbi:hypothetical protein [Undibacterium sp. Ren11W]|uniref:hypothetical protein n=1 Tax=Undibacterium sp. Ren11W TaxID=3413045 RepID=UPI003BF0F2D1
MRYLVLRAFFIGLAIFAVSHAIYYVLKISEHLNDGLGLFFILLGPFSGSVLIAILAPRFKFAMGVFLSVPASLLMGMCSTIAIELGVTPLSEYQGVNRVISFALMNFPFVLGFCALGAALGCIVSYKTAKRLRT